MKYIDADLLKERLDTKYKEFTEKAKKDCPLQYQYMADGLEIAEQFVDSLSEEPDKSLEKAAEEYIKKGYLPEAFVVRPAFISGAKWQEEQMLKDAVEGEVHPDDCEIWVNLAGYGYRFNDGDKVRIAILKEKDE